AQEWTTVVATAGDVVQMIDAVVALTLGHGEILCGDAVCVCDGQTPPTRRQVRDEWGHPRFIRYTQAFMAGPPACPAFNRFAPVNRKLPRSTLSGVECHPPPPRAQHG